MSAILLLLCIVFCCICGFKSFRSIVPIALDRRFNGFGKSTRIPAFKSNKFIPHASTFFFNGNSGQVNDKFRLDALKLNTSAVCDLLIEKPKHKLRALIDVAKKATEKLKRPRRSQSSVVVNGTSSPFSIALCVGGDGTVNWIMDETSALAANSTSQSSTSSLSSGGAFSQDIRFALIPSGTGNDLYRHIMQLLAENQSPAELRVLRDKIDYLSRCGNDGSAQEALSLFTNNNTVCVPFDRWQLTIEPLESALEVKVYRRLLKQFGPERAEELYQQWFRDTMSPSTRYRGVPRLEPLVRTFNNYFGLGVDAAVTHQFKEWRSRWPRWWFHTNVYFSRFFYGLAWVWLSLFDLFPRPLTSAAAGVQGNDVTVYSPSSSSSSSGGRRRRSSSTSGEVVDLFASHQQYAPLNNNTSSSSSNRSGFVKRVWSGLVRAVWSLWTGFKNMLKMPSQRQFAGLVIANINSFAGGGRLWPRGISKDGLTVAEARSDDGKLEVTGLSNWAHLCLVTFRLDNASPLCQAEGGLTLESRRRDLPLQVDGEPWIQHDPCKITIKHLNSVKLLLPRLPSSDSISK